MEVRLLGPLQVWIDGEDRAPAGRIRRAIVGLLALDAGRAIDADTLIDRIWNGSPPTTARASLQMHVTHIRRQLGPEDLLVTAAGGYRLDLDPSQVDAVRFADQVREGREHITARRLARAEELLAEAIRSWSEPPLPDLIHLDAARPHLTELTALHQDAEIALATARLEEAGHAPDLAELERLVEVYPLDERTWRLLMLGLYRSGRQVDALAAFQRASDLLASELGLEPGPALKEIEGQILERDPDLDFRDRHPISLPGFTTPFVGRDEAIRLLSKATGEQRLITLVGIGGVGKTRLAVETARVSAPGFAGGAFFATFESIDDAELVGRAIVESVSQEEETPATSPAAIIGDRHLLLVLDNCEHLAAAVGAEVVRLLRRCPGLTILATSRVPLGINGEATWAVSPLETPADGESVDDLHSSEAVRFFEEAARRVNHDFAITLENASSVARLCRELAGIPLALELAAANCDVMTPADLHRALTEKGRRLSLSERGRPDRHHSLDDMVEWSLDLLDPLQRHLFEKMAVFAGPVDRTALELVWDAEEGTLDEALRQLAHNSLITVDVSGARARYGLLPPLRQAAARRVASEEWTELRKAHAYHFFHLAETGREKIGSGAERAWIDDVEAALTEFRAAFDFARTHDPAAALRAAVALSPYWHARARVAEARHHVHTLRARVTGNDPALSARALKTEGTLAFAMADLAEAERLLSEAVDAFSLLGDSGQMAACLNNLGAVAVDAGDLLTALARYEHARELFEVQEDRPGLAATSLNLGVVALQAGEYGSAREWFSKALDQFRALHNRGEEAHALERLAHVAHFEGSLDEAREWIEASRRINVEIRATDAVARGDWLRAEIALDGNEFEVAAASATRSADAVRNISHHSWWTPGLLEASARIALRLDLARLAAVLVGAANAFRRRTGISRPAISEAAHDDLVLSLEDRLGQQLSAALASGESLSVQETLELVVRELGARSLTDTGR